MCLAQQKQGKEKTVKLSMYYLYYYYFANLEEILYFHLLGLFLSNFPGITQVSFLTGYSRWLETEAVGHSLEGRHPYEHCM
jgi:hypothetical protein